VLLALTVALSPACAMAPAGTGAPSTVQASAAPSWISGIWAEVARLWAPIQHFFTGADSTSGDPTSGSGGLDPGSGGGIADPNGLL
jgi:hypothetical protein